MTSRERVLKTLRHRLPINRVAIDIGGTEASGIAVRPYNGIKKLLGIDSPTRMYNVKQGLAEVEIEVLDVLGGDMMPLKPQRGAYGLNQTQFKPWHTAQGDDCMVPIDFNPTRLQDGGYVLERDGQIMARMPNNGYYFDTEYNYPLRNVETINDIERLLAIDNIPVEEIMALEQKAKCLYHETDKAITYRGGGSIFDQGRILWGYDKFLMLFYDAPGQIECAFERLTDSYIAHYEDLLPTIGQFINIVWFADDLGTQQGLPISPNLYRRYVTPYYRRIIECIKKHSDCYVMLHSDGGFREIIGDLIDVGFDILNPLQYNVPGMNAAEIKREFGDDLCFLGGGCDTQYILPYGSPVDIRNEAEKMLNILTPGGGYIFSQVHNILADVPAENVLALYETAAKFSIGD